MNINLENETPLPKINDYRIVEVDRGFFIQRYTLRVTYKLKGFWFWEKLIKDKHYYWRIFKDIKSTSMPLAPKYYATFEDAKKVIEHYNYIETTYPIYHTL